MMPRDAKRDIGAELLQSVREMVHGEGVVVFSLVIVSAGKIWPIAVRTLQSWEQGRKQPSGAARTLIKIARMLAA